MNIYIAFIRGINVSGQKIIKMPGLKSCFEELNFSEVQTYIQSGNVIFKTEKESVTVLEKEIEMGIMVNFGFDVTTMVLSADELKAVISNNPFNKEKLNPDFFYVTLLSSLPLKENIEKLDSVDQKQEKFSITGKTIYLYVPHGYGRTKLNNNFFEKKLKINATTRNWKTMNNLLEMIKKE